MIYHFVVERFHAEEIAAVAGGSLAKTRGEWFFSRVVSIYLGLRRTEIEFSLFQQNTNRSKKQLPLV